MERIIDVLHSSQNKTYQIQFCCESCVKLLNSKGAQNQHGYRYTRTRQKMNMLQPVRNPVIIFSFISAGLWEIFMKVLSLAAHTGLFLGRFSEANEVHWSSSQSLNSWECFGNSDANKRLPILPMMLHRLAAVVNAWTDAHRLCGGV